MSNTRVVELIGTRLRDLHLVPFAGVQQELLQELADDLSANGFEVTIEKPRTLPEHALHQEEKKYAGQSILDFLRQFEGGRILGVMDEVIYNYVIQNIKGIADFAGKAAVISLNQLIPTTDSELLRRRICKLAIHELGHTFGMEHCDNNDCVMHDGRSMEIWDIAKSCFCCDCHLRLKHGPYLELI